jgi:hypothetical protein
MLTDVSEVCAASIIRAMMEAARTSEMSVDIQLRTWQYIPEDSELQMLLLCVSYILDILLSEKKNNKKTTRSDVYELYLNSCKAFIVSKDRRVMFQSNMCTTLLVDIEQ